MVHGDHVLLYYSGTNHRSGQQMRDLGEHATSAIGLATCPIDGFVSVDSGKGWLPHRADAPTVAVMDSKEALLQVSQGPESFGQLVTRSFGFKGSQLHINCGITPIAAGPGLGEVRVELLTSNHRLIPGYSFQDADPITRSALDQVISWNGNTDISCLQDQAIKLRFYFKNTKLYSFQFR